MNCLDDGEIISDNFSEKIKVENRGNERIGLEMLFLKYRGFLYKFVFFKL